MIQNTSRDSPGGWKYNLPLMQQQSWLSKANSEQQHPDCLVYIGTYTSGASRGIHACRFSAQSSELSAMSLAAETVNPSFLCVHPSGRFLYAAGEISRYDGHPTGLVIAYAIDRETGALEFLNQIPSCGAGPCHISTDKIGRTVLVANYAGGSVAAIRILNDGRLGRVTSFHQHSDAGGNDQLRRRPRAHGAFVSDDNRFVVVPDLGLDRLLVYRLGADKGLLEPAGEFHVDLEPGTGPRHFAFHPSGQYGYAICQTDSTVRAFHWDSVRGSLRQFDVLSTLPLGYQGSNIAAEIQIDQAGRFLYASNRGADCIAVFAISGRGDLELVEHVAAGGKTPRHFSIDSTGSYLLTANQDTGSIVLFRRDMATGRLATTGRRIAVDDPACIAFIPAPAD